MVAPPTPEQQRTVDRFEELIGAISPALDFVLGVGERVSNIVQPEDRDYYPVRSGPEASLLARGDGDEPGTAD